MTIDEVICRLYRFRRLCESLREPSRPAAAGHGGRRRGVLARPVAGDAGTALARDPLRHDDHRRQDRLRGGGMMMPSLRGGEATKQPRGLREPPGFRCARNDGTRLAHAEPRRLAPRPVGAGAVRRAALRLPAAAARPGRSRRDHRRPDREPRAGRGDPQGSRARPAGLRPVRALYEPRPAGRSRRLADLQHQRDRRSSARRSARPSS